MFGFKSSKQSRVTNALQKLETGDIHSCLEDLYKLALEEDCPEAEYWLGDIHEFILKNLPDAAIWYRCAAEHGHPKSQWAIANLYLFGIGVEFNPKEAIKWYRAAAGQNIPEAQFTLGEIYRNGSYVEKDHNGALSWYQKAAMAGYEPAKTRVNQFWKNGIFQERQRAIETPNQGPVINTHSSYPESLSLYQMIIDAAQQQGYFPDNEFPSVPELRPHQEEIVRFICAYINKDMKNKGLNEADMNAVFMFVFHRAFGAVYQWHKSPDGIIDNTIQVGNPFNDDQFLQLPIEMKQCIKSFPAPAVYSRIMLEWWSEHRSDLLKKGIDIWEPLTVALGATYWVAVSIALKLYGYRK